MRKTVFIVNPVSGTSSGKDIREELEKCLENSGVSFRIVFTGYAGHAQEIAREAASEADVVVAVGGDGTVNEVARSLAGTDAALGIVPVGSGNGLARHLGIPMDIGESVKRICSGDIVRMDYGSVNGRPFFCTCGMGFDAEVSHKFSEMKKRGFMNYVRCVLGLWGKYEPQTYSIEFGAQEEGNPSACTKTETAFLITVANASQWGNNAFIAPKASTEDGLLDIVAVKPFGALSLPGLAWKLFHRKLDGSSKVTSYKADAFTIRRTSPGVIHIDGDPVGEEGNLVFRIHRGGLNIVK